MSSTNLCPLVTVKKTVTSSTRLRIVHGSAVDPAETYEVPGGLNVPLLSVPGSVAPRHPAQSWANSAGPWSRIRARIGKNQEKQTFRLRRWKVITSPLRTPLLGWWSMITPKTPRRSIIIFLGTTRSRIGPRKTNGRLEQLRRTLGAVAPPASLRCSIFVEVWPAHNLLQECSSAVSATLIPPSKVHCRSGGD